MKYLNKIISLAIFLPLLANAQQYKFFMGPYPDMATNPSACNPLAESWYKSKEAACQATTSLQPACDRNNAVYANDVAVLEGDVCHLRWVYHNKDDTYNNWYPWEQYLSLATCPADSMLREDNTTCVPIVDLNVTPKVCPVKFGDPIYPLTGTRNQAELIGSWGGQGSGLSSISIVYESRGQLPATDRSAAIFKAPVSSFGSYWITNALTNLVVNGNSSSVIVSRGNGQWVSFALSSSGGYQSGSRGDLHLFKNAAGWLYKDDAAGIMEQYDANGVLQSVVTSSGAGRSYSYNTDTAGHSVVQVADQFGRGYSFTYGAANQAGQSSVATITDPAGQAITLSYSSSGQLTSVTWADGSTRQYLYERSDLPWALTGIIDENNSRFSTYTYDSQGYAVGTALAGGVDQYAISYTTPPRIVVGYTWDPDALVYWRSTMWLPPEGLVVTMPNGTTSNLSAIGVQGASLLSAQTQAAGSGCAASSKSQAYDANGYISSKTDFNGSQSCYVNDPSRGLVTTQVDGLSSGADCSLVTGTSAVLPAGSYKTSKTWHPSWSQPIAVAEPKKITTYVYNGQPDPFNGGSVASCAPASAVLPDASPIAVLCKSVEQATTDVDGSAGFNAVIDGNVPNRVWQWTYNAQGQRLTVTDPRGNASTYGYYASAVAGTANAGDLQTVTNAQGQASQFTQYDAYGNVLQSVDANGVVSSNTYDARQRLTATTTAGQTTTYQYDLAGQLIKVTPPDGASVTMRYDAAHRLVGVTDALGNSISYTLDGAGNRTGQQVNDPTGVLAARASWVFDALNRKQQATGRD